MENNTQALINCRKNKKLLGRVRAFDEPLNMEIWTELPMIGEGREQARPVHKDRFISKMFLIMIMIGPEDTETDQLDKCDREVYLPSTAITVGPEQGVATEYSPHNTNILLTIRNILLTIQNILLTIQ